MIKNKAALIQLIFLAISNISNLIQFAIQLFLARSLTVDDFGILNAINSFSLTLLAVPSIIPYFVSREIIEAEDDQKSELMRKLSTYALLFAGVLFIGLLALTPFFRMFLKLPDSLALIVNQAMIGVVLYYSVLFGFFQSQQKFIVLASILCTQTALRLGLTVVFVKAFDDGVLGVVSANLLAFVIVTLWLALAVKPWRRETVLSRVSLKFRFSFSWLYRLLVKNQGIAVTMVMIGFLSNMDIFLVKSLFTASESGLYSSASLVGKIGFFAVSSLSFMLFPQILISKGKGNREVWSALFVTGSIGLVYTLLIYFFGKEISEFIWGEKLSASYRFAYLTSAYMSLVAFLNVLQTSIAASRRQSYLSFNIVPMLIFFLLLYKANFTDIPQFVSALIWGALFLVIANLGVFLAILRQAPSTSTLSNAGTDHASRVAHDDAIGRV